MRQRSISAIGIVLVSIVPAFIGGPFFMVVIAAIMLLAFRELAPMVNLHDQFLKAWGYAGISLATIAALLWPDGRLLPAALGFAVLGPLVSIVFRRGGTVDRRDWSSAIGSTLYLLLPAFAAVAVRSTEGHSRSGWFRDLADAMPGTDNTSAGLGWFLLALLVTWLSDTAAYLVGRSVGRTKLIPDVSPNKTVEGAIGGLVAAGITSVLCAVLFGLDIHLLTATILGLFLGAIGMLGDLSESMLKRRAGVKDSSNLIPGHGGMLDRIDAFIFVVVATWMFVPFFIS